MDTFRKLRHAVREVLNINCRDRYYRMHTTMKEATLFTKYTKASINYLEFGSGGSTYLMCLNTNANIMSVDSDLNFIKSLEENDLIYNSTLLGRLRFFYMDIGEILSWRRSKDNSFYSKYPMYSKEIFEIIDKNLVASIDTIFIDGRFRVACDLSSILNCNTNVTIIIHDFFGRHNYDLILRYLDRVDTPATCKIKPNIDLDDVRKKLEEYKYVLD